MARHRPNANNRNPRNLRTDKDGDSPMGNGLDAYISKSRTRTRHRPSQHTDRGISSQGSHPFRAGRHRPTRLPERPSPGRGGHSSRGRWETPRSHHTNHQSDNTRDSSSTPSSLAACEDCLEIHKNNVKLRDLMLASLEMQSGAILRWANMVGLSYDHMEWKWEPEMIIPEGMRRWSHFRRECNCDPSYKDAAGAALSPPTSGHSPQTNNTTTTNNNTTPPNQYMLNGSQPMMTGIDINRATTNEWQQNLPGLAATPSAFIPPDVRPVPNYPPLMSAIPQPAVASWQQQQQYGQQQPHNLHDYRNPIPVVSSFDDV